MKQFEISDKNAGQRLDKFLSRILKNAGMPFIYKMLRKKNITLNDKKAAGNELVNTGDVVKIYFSDETYVKLSGSFGVNENGHDLNLEKYIGIKPEILFKASVIYEDENIILINKPQGILSQKAKDDDISLNEYILYYLTGSGKLNTDDLKLYKPSVVNRLDRNTSGIVIAAKNLKASSLISLGLKERTINKYYKCAVTGSFDKEGLHKGYLLKDCLHNISAVSVNDNGGSYIETEYKLLEDKGDYSVLSVHLLTGRSHQIRAHLSYLGFPIIGDLKYGNAALNRKFNKNKQLLHAYKVVFPKYEEPGFEGISDKTFICDTEFRL